MKNDFIYRLICLKVANEALENLYNHNMSPAFIFIQRLIYGQERGRGRGLIFGVKTVHDFILLEDSSV